LTVLLNPLMIDVSSQTPKISDLCRKASPLVVWLDTNCIGSA
jgi:hypothetical protein